MNPRRLQSATILSMSAERSVFAIGLWLSVVGRERRLVPKLQLGNAVPRSSASRTHAMRSEQQTIGNAGQVRIRVKLQGPNFEWSNPLRFARTMTEPLLNTSLPSAFY